jgi:hypothetical protein
LYEVETIEVSPNNGKSFVLNPEVVPCALIPLSRRVAPHTLYPSAQMRGCNDVPRHDNRLPLTMENHPKEDPRLTLFNPPCFEARREVVNSELNKDIIHMGLNHKIMETDVEFRGAGIVTLQLGV